MTKIELCNAALMRAGAPAISSLTEGSSEADACALMYDSTRRLLLRQVAWPFAMQSATLALLNETPSGFDYAYQLPSDCIRVVSPIVDSSTAETAPAKYVVRGGKLLSDEEEVTILYISDEEDTTMFDDLFCDAFTYRLASEIVESLRGDSSGKRKELMQLADYAIRQARAVASREAGIRQLSQYSDFVAARG